MIIQIHKTKRYALLVLRTPPSDLRMIVQFWNTATLRCPFVICWLPNFVRLLSCKKLIILVVGDKKSRVVCSSTLNNSKQSTLRKSINLHGSSVIKMILMISLRNGLSFQVYQVNFIFRHIQNNHLFITHHPEEVNNVFVSVLKQNLSLHIEMNNALFCTGLIQPHQHKGSIVSSRGTQYFLHGLLELHLDLLLQKHLQWIIMNKISWKI